VFDVLKEELQQDLLNVSNTKWEFDKEKGLTLNKATLNNYGQYECIGKKGNVTYSKLFSIVVEGE
jgi:hypothetical protein